MPDARRLATAAFNLTLAAPRSCCSLCNPPSLQHSCLTRGDWLSVRHADSQYDLKICALTPEPACSVIDTDLEVGKQSCSCAAVMCGCSSRRLLLAPCGPACASPPRALPRYSSVTLLAHSPVCLAPQAEINPSIETEERIREEYEAAARRAAEAALAAAAAMQAAEAEEAAAAETAARRERQRQAKEAALPPEPPADSAEPIVTCLFRFPDGGRHSRRFPLAASLQVGGQLWFALGLAGCFTDSRWRKVGRG